MPQSGYTPIQLYRSTTASAVPSASDLATGEIAVNLTDEKLYFKNASGVVKLLASNAGASGSVTSVAASGGTTGLTVSGGPITGSGTLTLGGTLNVANGGTGATSLTSGYLLKGNGTSPVSASIVYDTGSAVGIGTPAPGSLLQLNKSSGAADLRFSVSGTLYAQMYSSSSDTSLYTVTSAPLVFGTNNSERMRVDGSGNVGIGTSAPAQRLDVYDGVIRVGGASQGRVLGYNATNTQVMDLGIGTGTGVVTDLGLVNVFAGNLVFGTSSTERMRIDNAGNVGIGTNSPATKLDVIGNVNVGEVLSTGTGVSTGDARIELGGNRTGSGTAYIDWHSAAGADFEARVIRYAGANGGMDIINLGTGGMVLAQIGAAPMVFKTADIERMRVASGGNVGIGTSSPSTALEVVGTATATTFSGAGTGLTGTAASLTAGAASTANAVANTVTFAASGGTGPGTTFNGSVARTVDYSTVGAPKADGTGASGTWGINISGNAATASTAANATNLVTSNYSIVESGGYLYIKRGATNICRIDSSGNAVFRGNVTGNDTSI